MSVLIECISVVVTRDTIERLYPGGTTAYERDCPNDTFCADDRLTRVGFMAPADVKAWVDRLQQSGFVLLDRDRFTDIAIVDQRTGPTAPCDWLRFGRHVAGFTMAWAPGSPPGPMNAPPGWHPGRTDQLRFTPNESMGEHMIPLGRQGMLDVYLDTRTGKETYVGRTDPAE